MSTYTNMSTPQQNNNEELDGAPNMAQSTSNAITNTLEASTPSLVDIALHRIKNAEDIERAGRKFDPLFEYHYFDRNRALHNFYANQQGKTIGTCAHESKMYAAQLVLSGKHKHKDVQLIAQTMDDGHGRQIYHVAILVKTPSGVRYITHSNGIYYTQRHSAPICTCGLDLWCISTNHLTRLQHGSTGGEIALFLFSNIFRIIFIGTFAGLIRERREEERSKRR